MFYTRDMDGTKILVVGYTGCHHCFVYRGIEMRTIVGLPHWEYVARLVLKQLNVPVDEAVEYVRLGIEAENDINSFLAELETQHDPAFYDFQRPMYELDVLRSLIADYRNKRASAAAKKEHTARRRRQFDQQRDELILQMLDAGVPYVCASDGCGVHCALTVDHIIALSRGGTDDLSNLRFLCAFHNSQKGDRSV